MKSELYEIIGDILTMDPSEVEAQTDTLKLGNPVSWDSLSHLAIMTELEDILDRELTIEEMEELDSLQKIIEILGS